MRNWLAILLGFVLGALLALAGAGIVGYSVYQSIQKRISPDAVRDKAQEQFKSILGNDVDVGKASLSLPNLLTLENIRFGTTEAPWLVIEKIEAAAEGGVDGLQAGRFAEIVLTNPKIQLVRQSGQWNFVEVLRPLLAARGAQASATGTIGAATGTKPGLPIKVIQVVGLDLSARVETGEASTVKSETLLISREDVNSPWTIYGENSNILAGTADGDWLLKDVLAAALGLFGSETDGPQTTVAAPGNEEGQDRPVLLGVRLENLTIQAMRPNEVLSMDGVSLNFDQLKKTLQFQTGSLEKKTLLFRA